MGNKYLDEISFASVKYYENDWLSPDVPDGRDRETTIDCAGYFYAYIVRLMQLSKKTRQEAEELANDLVNTLLNDSFNDGMKNDIIFNFNSVYLQLLDQFKEGIDQGEGTYEGFMSMLNSSSKIVASSIYWLENK
tara:strand:- start:1903 stop:2307 length:405 start_codon:yes stop_codon:yes gene_type:complete